MERKNNFLIYLFFLIVYVFSIIYNYINSSPWILDNSISLAFLIGVFFLNKWLKLTTFDFLIFNLALLLHNFGMFGFYGWSYSFIAYDMIVHFVSSFLAAHIIFKFLSKKLNSEKNKDSKKNIFNEHKAILIFLVVASVVLFGTFIELMEFTGSRFIGESDTLFSPGMAEGGFDNYTDTMKDTFLNLIGAILGAFTYTKFRYEKYVSQT